jgi:hypothetical protein
MQKLIMPERRNGAGQSRVVVALVVVVTAVMVIEMSPVFCRADGPVEISRDELVSLYYSREHAGFVPPEWKMLPESVSNIWSAFPFSARDSNSKSSEIVLFSHRNGSISLIGDEIAAKLVQSNRFASPWESPATGVALSQTATAFATFGDNGIIRVYHTESSSTDAWSRVLRHPLIIQEGWLVEDACPSDEQEEPTPVRDPNQLHIRVPVKGVTFSRDGKLLFGIMVDGSIHAWSATSGEYLRQVRAGTAERTVLDITPARWRPVGAERREYFRSSPDRLTLKAPPKLERWRLRNFVPSDPEIVELHLSDDEKSLAFEWRFRDGTGVGGPSAGAIDVDSGAELFRDKYFTILGAERSSNAWYVVQQWADDDHLINVDLIDSRTGKALAPELLRLRGVRGTAKAAGSVARLAVDVAIDGAGTKEVRVYEFRNRKAIILRVFDGVTTDGRILGLSPDGRWLLIGRKNGAIESYDVESGAVSNVTAKGKPQAP